MRTVLLLDTNAMAYRAIFSGSKLDLTAPDGTPTGGLLTFYKGFMKLISARSPTHVIALGDPPRATLHRKKLYPEYKDGRGSLPAEGLSELQLCIEMFTHLDVTYIEIPGYEADDLIATLARRWGTKKDTNVIICSPDKDLQQCITPTVKCLCPKTMMTTDAARAEAIWGLPPERIPDIQTICGDSTDNIPGVKGIGMKTALKLLLKYGDLQGIMQNLNDIPEVKRKAFREVNLDIMRDLVTLVDDVVMDVRLKDIKYTSLNKDRAMPWFRSLGFKQI